jgi:hypothetical protein
MRRRSPIGDDGRDRSALANPGQQGGPPEALVAVDSIIVVAIRVSTTAFKVELNAIPQSRLMTHLRREWDTSAAMQSHH